MTALDTPSAHTVHVCWLRPDSLSTLCVAAHGVADHHPRRRSTHHAALGSQQLIAPRRSTAWVRAAAQRAPPGSILKEQKNTALGIAAHHRAGASQRITALGIALPRSASQLRLARRSRSITHTASQHHPDLAANFGVAIAPSAIATLGHGLQ